MTQTPAVRKPAGQVGVCLAVVPTGSQVELLVISSFPRPPFRLFFCVCANKNPLRFVLIAEQESEKELS